MLYVDHRQEPSLKPMLIILVVIILISVYGFVSVLSGDPLWFSSRFNATPSEIYVHCYGETTEIEPGSGQFRAITTVVNQALSGTKRWDELSLSDQTYQDYKTRNDTVMLELYYPEPIRIHTNTRLFSNVSNLIIPLEGRHANTEAIFGRHNGLPAGGSLHIESNKPIRNLLAQQDICPFKQP